MSSSLRKIAANRRNAQKSTGPRTPQGKAAVRFNACTHGLTSTQTVFFDEDPELYQLALRDFEDEYHPATPTELRLVHLLADSFWRLSRSRRVQSDFLRFLDRSKKACQFSHYEDRIATEDRVAFLLGAERPTAFAAFSLYETRFERTLFRTLQTLERLQAQRASGLPDPDQDPDPTNPGSGPAGPPNPQPDPDPADPAPVYNKQVCNKQHIANLQSPPGPGPSSSPDLKNQSHQPPYPTSPQPLTSTPAASTSLALAATTPPEEEASTVLVVSSALPLHKKLKTPQRVATVVNLFRIRDSPEA